MHDVPHTVFESGRCVFKLRHFGVGTKIRGIVCISVKVHRRSNGLGDSHQLKAADLTTLARDETHPSLRVSWNGLQSITTAGRQADRSGAYVIDAHLGPPIFEQQQPRPKK
jgi:hypothetical protein